MMRSLVGFVCLGAMACAPVGTTDSENGPVGTAMDAEPADAAIEPSRVVAIVDGHFITRDEVVSTVDGLSPLLRAQFATPEGRRAFLRSLVDRQLIVAEGRRRALHETPEIRRRVRALEERLIAQALVAERRPAVPDEGALKQYFAAHREDFAVPAAVDVGRIALLWGPSAGPAARAEVRARAEAARARLIAGEPFDRVAREGDGPERKRGGRLGWRAREDFEAPAAAEAAFSIGEVGGLSPLVETADGIHLLTLFDRRRARQADLSDVRGEVIARYRKHGERAALDALAESLRQSAEIELRPENLEAP